MQPDEFTNIAIRLFGYGWSKEIAYRLGINDRSVRDMAKGKRPIPEPVAAIMRFWIAGLLNER